MSGAPLTPAWKQLRPHAKQSEAWRTRARFVALPCGRGSGKTELARRRLVRYLPVRKPWSDPKYFYALPTLAQAKRLAWQKILDLIPKEWIRPGGISLSDHVVRTVFGSEFHLFGMDKPERIEGDQWDGGVLDESCDQKPGAFDRSVRPALTHRDGWLWRIGVPKRFGPGAREFKMCAELWSDPATGPEYACYSWPSEGIVPDSELAGIRETTDQRDYDEQYGALWQGTSGAVFYAFVDVLNVRADLKYDSSKVLGVGSDFNVDPMAWVVLQQHGPEIHVIDELWIRNTNTQKTLDALYARYGHHKSGFVFIGDAAARARNTRASLSDYAQIRNDRRFEKARVLYPESNPAIADRFAATNAMLCNANGDRRLLIHPRCSRLIADLETRSYAEGTRIPDDYGDVGHITDALGYFVHYTRPLRATASGENKVFVGT